MINKNGYMEMLEKAIEEHSRVDRELGTPVDDWMHLDLYVAIKWSNGASYYYDLDKDGNVVWWKLDN